MNNNICIGLLKLLHMKNNSFINNIIEKFFDANHVKHAKNLIILFIIVIFLPILLTQFPISIFDFTETGQIGDTIGGITAPFIGIITGYLTFLAFHEQFKAIDQSKKDLARERFEGKFYNFLSLLNNLEINTNIPNVGNYKQAFHFMFYEYKAIAVLLKRKAGKCNNEKIKKDAFSIFLNGVSRSSINRLKEYNAVELNDYFLQKQKLYKDNLNAYVPYLDDYDTSQIRLFDGHRLRLIPFFRLVCKIIEMIYDTDVENKELYLSILLSMLSEHQIALLKIIYLYDADENVSFIIKNKKQVSSFLGIKGKEEDKENKNDDVCINKYIHSNVMNCEKDEFIDFDKGNSFEKRMNELGFLIFK